MAASDSIHDERERIASEREHIANKRDRVADERDSVADQREEASDARDLELDEQERRLANLELSLHVLDGHENPVAVGIVELKILGARPIGCLERPGSHVTAEAVRRVEHELTGIEGGSELRWQLHQLYPSSSRLKLFAQGTSVAGDEVVRVAPALATITNPMATTSRRESRWPRKRKPAAAPMAGSRLIRIPKSCLERRRSAANSSENGTADERTATTRPMPRLPGLRSAPPAPVMPNGSSANPATASANARPSGPGTRRPTLWLMTM